MARETQAYVFVVFPRGMRANRAEKRCGKIGALKQNADVAFREARISEDGNENFLGGVVKKCAQRGARRGSGFRNAVGEFEIHRW